MKTKEELKTELFTLISTIGRPPRKELDQWLKQANEFGMIQKKDLKDKTYYYGRCRNARVAMWDAEKEVFWYMRTKFGSVFKEDINHPEDDNEYDLFIPIGEVVPEEDEVIKE
jgi:hypothetical protein